jgi:hypothetical protein
MRRTLLWVCGLSILLGATGWAQVKPRVPARKKLIEYGWDVKTPAWVAAHLPAMEKLPFDGTIMRLAGKGGGNIFSGGRWKESDFSPDFAALRQLRFQKFTDNFLMIYSASTMDWFSDKDWEAVLANLAIMGRAAKVGGCNLAFDAEPYGDNPWNYATQKHAKDKSFAEYYAQARLRGRQFMQVVNKYRPNSPLLTFFTYTVFGNIPVEPDLTKRQAALQQHSYSLYAAFLAGMLDAMGPGVTITDGNEPSYYYLNSESYYAAYHQMRQGALGLVPPEDVAKFLTQTQASQALYMDYVFAKVPWKGIPALFMNAAERVKWFEHNTYWALRTTDEYVWLYSEKMDWWTNKDVPEGMEQAVINAREAVAANRPLGFDFASISKTIQERRLAEIAAKLVRRTADIPALTGPAPVIDGVLDDPAWQRAAQLPNFVGTFGTAEGDLKAKTTAAVTYDAQKLYVSVRCFEPQMSKLVATGSRHDDPIWDGDSMDIFLSSAAAGVPYWHFILNPKNVQWDAFCNPVNDAGANPRWESATKLLPDQWTVEVAIPWSELKITPAAGLKLRANVCRARAAGEREYYCWSQTVTGFLEPENFGTWVLK